MINSKLKSRKLFCAVWAMTIITVGLIMRIDLAWFTSLVPFLGSIVVAYVGIQGYADSKGSK
jgi:hypothetical protein